ncbi:hypothetical protein D3C71_1832060 [compost metagenome]
MGGGQRRVQQAFADQLLAQGTDQRLGHRKHDVPVLGTLTIEVALKQYGVALQDQESIGLAGDQVIDHADAQATFAVEVQLIQRLERLLERTDRPAAGLHVDRRTQARQVAETPLVERWAHPVVPGDAAMRFGGKALHE